MLVADFDTVESICFTKTGHSVMDFTLRGALSFYYGLLIKDKSREDRAKLDSFLDGEVNVDGSIRMGSEKMNELEEFEALVAEVHANSVAESSDGDSR